MKTSPFASIAGFALAMLSLLSVVCSGADSQRPNIVYILVDDIGYPPDLQEEAVKTVLMQAELLCADWV